MILQRVSHGVFALSFLSFLWFSCQNDTSATDKSLLSTAQLNVVLPNMPAQVDTPKCTIADLNFWPEGKNFYVTACVDNRSHLWQRLWVRVDFFDSLGQPLSFNGEPYAVVPTFSDAVPPAGRTSFFAGFPLDKFSGSVDSAVVTGAGAVKRDPGPILTISELSYARVLVKAHPEDTVATDEKGWQIGAVIDNPLPKFTAYSPRVEMLVYAKDKKLYLSQLLVGGGDTPNLIMEKFGPIEPGEKRRVGGSILYDLAPVKLREVGIERVEFQPFEARVDDGGIPGQ